MEFDFSILPYNWADLEGGLHYKADVSYLYHFRGKRRGIYLGGGPGFICNHHAMRLLLATWCGYQFASQQDAEERMYGFIDWGVTTLFQSHGQVIFIIPTIRSGLGFTF